MSTLTQEEKETYDITLCKPETYLTIISDLDYYQRQGNTEAVNAFLSLKTQMEQKCDIKAIKRSLNGRLGETYIPTPKRFTYENFTLFEIDEKGILRFIPPKENTVKIAPMPTDAQLALNALESKNYEEQHRKTLFPEICSAACTHRQCGYYRLENFGKPCEKQQEQYKTAPSWLKTRSLDPDNEPNYRSPLFREEKTEKPKKELKESLNPSG